MLEQEQIEVNKDPYGTQATLSHHGVRVACCLAFINCKLLQRRRSDLVIKVTVSCD